MVELQSKRLRDWFDKEFGIPSFYSYGTRLLVKGNVITGVTPISYSYTRTEQETLTYGESKVSSIQTKVSNKWGAVTSVQNEISILNNELSKLGRWRIIKRMKIQSQINQLEVKEKELSQKALEFSQKQHKESVTRTSRRECFVALYIWNLDYVQKPDVPVLGPGINLHKIDLTEQDVSKMLVIDGSSLQCKTTCNDNAILALLDLDEKKFNQVLEQAEKNRRDAEIKAYLASDKKLKIKFIKGDLEELIA